MKPTEFPGFNVTIAKDQHPYIPLPAQAFGDNCGTLLTCWELSEEDLEHLIRTRKVWVTTLTFNQALQPFAILADKPVAVCDGVAHVQWLDFTSQPGTPGTLDDPTLWGYKEPGWYYFDEGYSQAYGPYGSQSEAAAKCAAYCRGLAPEPDICPVCDGGSGNDGPCLCPK